MSNASAGQVQCPVCLNEFDWEKTGQARYVWSVEEADHLPLSRRPGESERHWNQRSANTYIRCPSPGDHYLPHHLPALYGAYGEPIIIPAIGQTASGKTTLLTMIGAELERSPALSGELSFRPLDQAIGERFYANYVRPLLEERRPPAGTSEDTHDFFQAWRCYNHRTGRPFVLAFFDSAGGDLVQDNYLPSFIRAASGFLFLVNANDISWSHEDMATANVLDLLGTEHFDALPAATVIAKADVFQERPAVQKWLGRKDENDLSTIEQESEDAYAFLSVNARPGWLRPARDLPLSTLHFVSATGTAVDEDSRLFDERLFGPRRVLRPLLSLLKAIGVIEPSQFTSGHDSRRTKFYDGGLL